MPVWLHWPLLQLIQLLPPFSLQQPFHPLQLALQVLHLHHLQPDCLLLETP
jgi:hypothetical protein